MRLRYVGTSRVTFTDPRVGAVSPGDEFNVPDEETTGYLARADVVTVDEVPDEVPEVTLSLRATRARSDPKPAPTPEPEGTPDTTGESADVAADS